MRARATGAGAPARGRGRSMNRPLQSDNCSIADATEIWIKLGENLELQNFEQVVKGEFKWQLLDITYWQI